MQDCGDCKLCCSLLEIKALSKPKNKKCQHLSIIKGCSIYNVRPSACRRYNCLWQLNEAMPADLRPDRCGIMFEAYRPEMTVVATVDMDRPNVWKNGKPNSLIGHMLRDGYVVWIMVSKVRHLLLPEGTTEAEAHTQAVAAYRSEIAA